MCISNFSPVDICYKRLITSSTQKYDIFVQLKVILHGRTIFSFIPDQDIYRTGAKCISGGVQDPLGEGANYHITGALR